MRDGLIALGRGAHRERRLVAALQRRLGVVSLRRLWAGWWLLVQLTRERHEAASLRRDLLAASHADGRARHRCMRQWQRHAEVRRFEASVATKKEDLWNKVHGWLGELG